MIDLQLAISSYIKMPSSGDPPRFIQKDSQRSPQTSERPAPTFPLAAPTTAITTQSQSLKPHAFL